MNMKNIPESRVVAYISNKYILFGLFGINSLLIFPVLIQPPYVHQAAAERQLKF